MTRRPRDQRSRVVVPFDLKGMLSAPYGWTNRMRQEEGHPERWEGRPGPPIGILRNVGIATLMYGPGVVGAVAGWLGWGGWRGALLGVGAAVLVQVIAALLIVPVLAFRRRRSSDDA